VVDNLHEGDVIAGRYRLERILGQGGMGCVWAATHLVTGRTVAMKFLLGSLHTRNEMRQRFLREARAAVAVDHPNVVEIYDVFDLDDGTPVMVMAFLKGETLSDLLEREERLPVPRAADLLLPVVSAVGTAHTRGIVHRDLKPENVFLARDGASEVVKVLDFGIAKLVSRQELEGGRRGMTAAGTMLGTPAYMSPEQAIGDEDVDHRSDIWTLGVILYEALSGVRPLSGETVGQVVRQMLQPIAPIEAHLPDLPGDLASLVGRMMSHDRADRPADLREVFDALARYATRVGSPTFGTPQDAAPDEPLDLPAISASAPASVWRTGAGQNVDVTARTVVSEAENTHGPQAISVSQRRLTQRWTLIGLGLGVALASIVAWLVVAGGAPEPPEAAAQMPAPPADPAPAAPPAEPPVAAPPAETAAPIPVEALPRSRDEEDDLLLLDSEAASPGPFVGTPALGPRPAAPRPAATTTKPEAAPTPPPKAPAQGLHEDVPF
jgi:eukaryotic-like serine/threonine-protein kinase